MNNGKPLDTNGGRLPSIDYTPSEGSGNDIIIIAFQGKYNVEWAELVVQYYQNGIFIIGDSFNPYPSNPYYFTQNLNPVIAKFWDRFILVWGGGGLFCRPGQVTFTEIEWFPSTSIPNSDNNSTNPAIVCRKDINSFHLV